MSSTLDATSEFPGMFGSPRTPARAFQPVRVPERTQGAPIAVSTPAPGPESEADQEPGTSFAPRARSESACRILNVFVALVLLLITLPITLLTALLIKVTSRGPVFYTQTRVGIDRRWNRTRALYERRREDLGGEQFTIIKFRSMRVDAEVSGNAVWATKDDDRVTPIGRFIRATRIDELPQLLNVLRGDMNVVGPRPERPSIFVRLREEIALLPVRQRVKPGITGWAQINRSYDTDVDGVREKLRLDVEYLQTQSLVTDLRIMARTVPVMLFRIGGW
jgi:lipopolysaccharide/colanic/teichoic acid biosynthesis glycosyltransferase